MDRDLLHQHLTPHDITNSSATFFFNPCGGGGWGFAAAASSVVAPNYGDDCWWTAGDLMQFGGSSSVGTAADNEHHHQLWQSAGGPYRDDNNPPAPPPCTSTMDGDHGDYGATGKQGSVPELASSEQNKKNEKGNMAGATQRKGRDRAKTVVLERKRRVRMQEKLYELRALVPNITKMDKASIIGDAVVYVRNLQSRARKLKEEVAALEARRRPESTAAGPPQHEGDDRRATEANDKRRDDYVDDRDLAVRRGGSSHVVASVGAARVGEGGRFLVTVECERRDGVAARLCAAVESLQACFRVEGSSLGRAAPDRVVSTAMLKATCPAEAATIGEGTVKLLVLAALGEQGFRIDATAGIS